MDPESLTYLNENLFSILILMIVILILLSLSALNSSLEMSLAGANRIRIKTRAEAKEKSALRALKIIEKYEEYSTTIIIINNIVNILLATLSSAFFVKLFPNYGVLISTILMTVLILIFGEIIPKIYGKKNAEKMLYKFGGFLIASKKLINPLVKMFLWISQKFQERFSNDDEDTIEQQEIEEEILTILEESSNEGKMEIEDGELIRNAIEFNDIRVSEILQPKSKFVSIDVDDDTEDILKILKLEKYSRVPVYENDSDNIIGVLYERDFYEKYTSSNCVNVKEIVRDALFVPDTIKISKLLVMLKEYQNHMSIVVDERGTVVGLCTIEDIIEELVGEIYDEHESVEENISIISDTKYLMKAEYSINDFNDLFPGKEITTETDEDTLAGYLLEIAQRIPMVDEEFEDEHFKYKIKKITGKSIEEIVVEIKKEENDEAISN